MKIYLNSPKESWVVDRFVKEWKEHNKSISTNFISKCDLLWIIAPWTWEKIPKRHLSSKKVVCTIHHLDEKKFNIKDFKRLDEYVDTYHIITNKTRDHLENLTNKPIFYSPFWIDGNKFYQIKEKRKLRKNLNLPLKEFLVGSFQRDTEGSDNISPKLEKGPDNFIKILENLKIKNKNLKVVLTGKRRDYIINKLDEIEIPYYYFQMVDNKKLNDLYNSLDLYVVASRVEGGPQSILECAITKTPIISTDVGIASEILSPVSIFNMNNYDSADTDIDYAFSKVQKYLIPNGFNNFLSSFKNIYEN